MFAADGTLQTEPGYHPRSQTCYEPTAGFAIPDVPDRPSAADIESARDLICTELLGDFPFVSDAELAHATALSLLPFARDLIDGPTPLHLIEKPTPGTGATLLVDMVSLPATGRPNPVMTEGRNEDEWRKRITAKLLGGPQFLLIDNLRRTLDSGAVSAAITAPTWEDRVLGGSTMARIQVRCAWVATGNNPSMSTEIARRSIRIRLDARLDRPWLRSGFRHPDLRLWAMEHRGQLTWAALTMIRTWVVAGKPSASTTLGMFEHWAKTIGGILQVAGVKGFLENREAFYDEADSESVCWRLFVAAWWGEYHDHPIKVADLYQLAGDAGLYLGKDESCEQSRKIVLGKMLASRRDRVYDIEHDGRQLHVVIQRGELKQRSYLWRLRAVTV